MPFSTPWSPDTESWQAYVPAVSTPGLDPACARPSPGRPPVVHHFHQLILLPRGPFDLPPAPPTNYRNLLAAPAPAASWAATPPPPTVVVAGGPCPAWTESRLRWGLFVAYEQAWQWQGTSLGELIESISLAPREELEIQVFTWDRTKTSRDLETTDLVDQKSETSLTMHSSAQVLRRMQEEIHWDFGVNVGYSAGITAGVELGVGQSSSDVTERRREQTQDLTSRTARQVRSERRVAISTVRETGIEERRTRKLVNRNPTRTVTYNFYETLSHYRVEIAPVETSWVVAIPNSLPAVTPAWVACHEGILREHLLDLGQSPGFDAARRLARQFPSDPIREAVARLHHAFVSQPMGVISPPRPWRAGPERPEPVPLCITEATEEPPILEKIGRALAAIFTGGMTELVYGVVELAGGEPAPAEGERYSYHFIENFLGGVIQTPSVPGLLAAMKLVADWYKPYQSGRTRCLYRVSAEVEAALGFAYSVLVQGTGEFPPELSLPEDATDESKKAAREAWLEWKRERQAVIDQLVADQMAFEALRCHISDYILHYMRPIWLSEDPGQRFARLSRELLGGIGDAPLIARLIEQPLLGFHLNCSVFPIRLGRELERALRDALEKGAALPRLPNPEGAETFVHMLSIQAKGLRSRVTDHFARIADQRFQREGRRILDTAIRDAVRNVLTCKRPQEPDDAGPSLTPAMLPEVITIAQERIHAILKTASKGPLLYLTDEENVLRGKAEDHLDGLAEMTIDAEATAENLDQLLATATLAGRVTRERDFKPIMVTLPDGGYYCEPVLGQCSAAEDLRGRAIEAETASSEAFTRQAVSEAERRERRLAEGNLEGEEPVPTVRVVLEQEP